MPGMWQTWPIKASHFSASDWLQDEYVTSSEPTEQVLLRFLRENSSAFFAVVGLVVPNLQTQGVHLSENGAPVKDNQDLESKQIEGHCLILWLKQLMSLHVWLEVSDSRDRFCLLFEPFWVKFSVPCNQKS